MLALSVQSPFASMPRSPGRGDVVDRAIEAAGTVSGAYATSPCVFLTLGKKAADLVAPLRPEAMHGGTWVLVAALASGESDQKAHLHERCLTAAQRVMLALSCDGVDNAWVGEGLPDADAFEAAAVGLGGRVPLGLIWCAAD